MRNTACCWCSALIPFTFIGTIAPQVTQEEYYYPFVPLMVLVSISAASLCFGRAVWILPLLLLSTAILATSWTWHEYQGLAILKAPDEWPASVFHEAGLEARQVVGNGRVLALDPIVPDRGRPGYLPRSGYGRHCVESRALCTSGGPQPLYPDGHRQLRGEDRSNAAGCHPDDRLAKASQVGEEPLEAWARSHHWTPYPPSIQGEDH